MSQLIHELNSKWYQFQFYEDHFDCQFKKGLFRHVKESVRYQDIEKIEHNLHIINFVSCHQFDFYIKGRKKLSINANTTIQTNELNIAINFIQKKISNLS